MDLTPFHGPPATAPRVPGFAARTLLGFGTHGEVWLADDLTTGGSVALKIGRRVPDESVAASGDPPGPGSEQETALLCRIDHPHIVRLQRVVPLPAGGLAMVLDLASGGSLASLIAARGRFDPGEVSTLLVPLADALDHLHRRGVAHGDIAPGNVLFTGDGRPQLGDLGVARVLGTRVEEAWATPGFTDPALIETGVANPDLRAADLWGLAAVGWFALTGHPPDPADAGGQAVDRAPRLGELLRQCLAAAPPERPSLRELGDRAWQASRPVPIRLVAGSAPEPDEVGLPPLPERVTHRVTVPDDGPASTGSAASAGWLGAAPAGHSRGQPVDDPIELRTGHPTGPMSGQSRDRGSTVRPVTRSVAARLLGGWGSRASGRPRLEDPRSSGSRERPATDGSAAAGSRRDVSRIRVGGRSLEPGAGARGRGRARRARGSEVRRRSVGVVVLAVGTAVMTVAVAVTARPWASAEVRPEGGSSGRTSGGSIPSASMVSAGVTASTAVTTSSRAGATALLEAELTRALTAIGRSRAVAFGQASARHLAAADVAGSPAYQADLELVQRLRSRGYRLRGVRYEVSEVRVLHQRGQLVEVRAVITTSGHRQVRVGSEGGTWVPADGPRPIVLTVAPVDLNVSGAGRWRVRRVEVPS